MKETEKVIEERLESKRPQIPDDFLFSIEPISGPITSFPILNEILTKKSSESQHDSAHSLQFSDSTEISKLNEELLKMRAELETKQAFYQEQFSRLREWMCSSFEVESPQVLLDYQQRVKEAEMAAEDAATEGNSKQHQRIRTLSLNLKAKEAADEAQNAVEQNSLEIGKTATTTGPGPSFKRPSKNLSRMSQHQQSVPPILPVQGGQGQKDLSAIKSKIPNQIPINVFWNYIEPFFKPIDEDDLKYLDDLSHVMDVAPFMIPALGSHYENIWYEQYGYIVPGNDNKKRPLRSLNEVSGGKATIELRDRLLSALIDKTTAPECDSSQNFVFDDFDGEYEDEVIDQHDPHQVNSSESKPLDERIKSNLIELGFTDLKTTNDFKEDDEICIEMRSVQRQLREQIVINQYRKKRLAEFIRTKLAAQEFYSLLGDIDKQIEGIFHKRTKNSKKKKKSPQTPLPSSTLSNQATTVAYDDVPVEAIQCLENRTKLIETFSDIIPSRIETYCPTKLVEFDANVEDSIVKTAKSFSKWFPLPEIPLKQPLSNSQPAFPNSRKS